MIRKSGFNVVYRILVGLLFILSPLISTAQDISIPCSGGDDYDSSCPLDTWVILLAVVACITASIYLHRKQKSLQA
jgi:hypothetical protein